MCAPVCMNMWMQPYMVMAIAIDKAVVELSPVYHNPDNALIPGGLHIF